MRINENTAGNKVGISLGKRGLSFLLIILITISGSTLINNGSNTAYAESDSAAALLSAMGIITDDGAGNYNMGKTLTRAEFAKMIVMASAYKGAVAQSAHVSIYKDVPYTHWAAPYVKIAAANGILNGYSDGTFRPESAITYEQAINSALKLLGYGRTDFSGGVYPYPQINLATSLGLTTGIYSGVGAGMTKADGVNLISNLLNCPIKDGSKIYAVAIGYKVNTSGQIDYASALSANMSGPVTVMSTSWATGLGLDTATAKVYRNGSLSSFDGIKTYDLAYYSAVTNTIWAYSNKVSGIYERAVPNQDAPTAIVLSGKTYTLSGRAAFASLSSVGTLKPGSSITLLLDKDGNIGDAVSSALVSAKTTLYVTAIGEKTYQDIDGNDYTAKYIAGVSADGTEQEYTVTDLWEQVGDVVSVGVSGGSLSVSKAGSGGMLSGKMDSGLMQLGVSRLASNIAILDTHAGSCALLSPQRLDGLTISQSEILYYESENGQVTQLILKNVTGDTARYGIVLSAKRSSSGISSSGQYTYMIGGVTATLSTTGMSYGVNNGPAAFYSNGSAIRSIINITGLRSYKITEVGEASLMYEGKLFRYADKVNVFQKSGSSYVVSNTAGLVAAVSKGKTADYYYDKLPEYGGRIRLIILAE